MSIYSIALPLYLYISLCLCVCTWHIHCCLCICQFVFASLCFAPVYLDQPMDAPLLSLYLSFVFASLSLSLYNTMCMHLDQPMEAPLLRRSAEEAKAAAPSFNKEPEHLSFIMIKLKLKWKVDYKHLWCITQIKYDF